ncbi:unnamed protein product [Arabis nemorensis]|uniref:fructose-bisphosphate aldolase n=1 Tax=Arabis nemorensis TaxID=586526 RepID=A0A565ASJ5_9BRAS|nr:unnamed protein product [Arabis nemorensis]
MIFAANEYNWHIKFNSHGYGLTKQPLHQALSPDQVASYTLKLLGNRVPPTESWQVLSFTFLSGGQSDLEAIVNMNAMNQGLNSWHVSFSYAHVLHNTFLKTWGGREENVNVIRAKAIR